MADKVYTAKQVIRKLKRLRQISAGIYSRSECLEVETSEWILAKIRSLDEAIAAFQPKARIK